LVGIRARDDFLVDAIEFDSDCSIMG
jgi:hypothetical protein